MALASPKVPLIPVTLNLLEGDREILKRFYPDVGYQIAVRTIISRHCRALVERESRGQVHDAIAPDISDILGTAGLGQSAGRDPVD